MTNKDLIKEISGRMEVTQKDAEKFLKTLAETVHEKVMDGEKVVIKDVCSIDSKVRDARIARNPKTGEKINVPAKTVPVVKPASALKDKLASK